MVYCDDKNPSLVCSDWYIIPIIIFWKVFSIEGCSAEHCPLFVCHTDTL